jgi:hypothetical protein
MRRDNKSVINHQAKLNLAIRKIIHIFCLRCHKKLKLDSKIVDPVENNLYVSTPLFFLGVVRNFAYSHRVQVSKYSQSRPIDTVLIGRPLNNKIRY